jgi:hypothetical protein
LVVGQTDHLHRYLDRLHAQRENQPDVPSADIGDEFLEPSRPSVVALGQPVSSLPMRTE